MDQNCINDNINSLKPLDALVVSAVGYMMGSAANFIVSEDEGNSAMMDLEEEDDDGSGRKKALKARRRNVSRKERRAMRTGRSYMGRLNEAGRMVYPNFSYVVEITGVSDSD